MIKTWHLIYQEQIVIILKALHISFIHIIVHIELLNYKYIYNMQTF